MGEPTSAVRQRWAPHGKLFDNDDGRFEFKGNSYAALWPGDGRLGLWMNTSSRMGALYNLIVRQEELYVGERRKNSAGGGGGGDEVDESRDEGIELVVSPVFEGCMKVLDAEEQRAARDLYWAAMTGIAEKGEGGLRRAEELLSRSCKKNPFVGEPHLVLAQVHASCGRFEEAEREPAEGLRLLLE